MASTFVEPDVKVALLSRWWLLRESLAIIRQCACHQSLPTSTTSCSLQCTRCSRAQFLDLPSELRHHIYKLVLLTQKVFRMSLDPTLRPRSQDNTWGSRNRFALLSTSRQIYNEASPLAYGDNFFRVARNGHCGLHVPRAPGMPLEKIHHLALSFPHFWTSCGTDLGHVWAHWLQDALYITQRFPNLKRLNLEITREDYSTFFDDESWTSLLSASPTIDEKKRSVKMIAILSTVNGRRMPACVWIGYCTWGYPDEQFTSGVNMAIRLSSRRHVSDGEKIGFDPRWKGARD